MDRTEYNQCMRPHMQGSKTREQRQHDMCVGAKICTGKAKTKEEAERLCSQPRESKTKGSGQQQPYSCEEETRELARCAAKVIGMNLANNVSMETSLTNALIKCRCHQK